MPFLERTMKDICISPTIFPSPLVLEGRKKTKKTKKVATIMERWAITKVISVDVLWGLIYLWNTVFCQEQRTNASSKYLKTGAN